MGRPRKTTETQEQLIRLMELFERVQNGESITTLARKLEMSSQLLNYWMEEIEIIDGLIKTDQVHNKEKEIWKNMYLKVAYKLEQLENRNTEN